jgi:nucleoside-diphosphate-sugar epimerase
VFDHIHDRTILRIPGLYGNPSSKRRNSVFDDLAQQCIEGGVRIDLEPENFRDWLSLDDLSRFVLGWACNQQVHDSSLRTFNLVSGNAWPVERWLRSVVQILGRKFEDTVFFERESVSKRAFDLVFDNTYLRKSYPTFIFGDRFQTLKNLVASFGVSTSSWERTQPSLAFSDDSQISEYMQ